MAKTQMQRQREINDRAVRKAARALSSAGGGNKKLSIGVVAGIIIAAALLITLNQFVFHISGIPTWNELFGIKAPISDAVADGEAKVHFIDVGQGDSELIVTKDKAVLIDSGEREYSGTVIQYIKALGIEKLDYIICTHPHSDHIGGMYAIIEDVGADTVIMPKVSDELVPTTSAFSRLLDSIESTGAAVKYAQAGSMLTLAEGSYIELLSPVNDYEDLNNYSIACRFIHGANAFLFTGDIEKDAESDILDSGADVRADVIKVPHHGSHTSSSYDFVKAVSPDYAVFEVGSPNDYGHPHKETLKTYEDIGCTMLRTDLNGSIVFTADGNTVTYETEK